MKYRKYLIGIAVLSLGLVILGAGCAEEAPTNPYTTSTTVTGTTPGTPNLSRNLIEATTNDQNLTTFVAAIDDANLTSSFRGAGPFTIFAPTNAAFDKVPSSTIKSMLGTANKQNLVNVLTFHVVPGKFQAMDLQDGQKLKTMNGEELIVEKTGGIITINGAAIEKEDNAASNGLY